MEQQITFRSLWFQDIATGSFRGGLSGFDREWPGLQVKEEFRGRGGYVEEGLLGTLMYTASAVLTSSAFASIIIAWLKSKQRKIHLQNSTKSVEYEGPDPKKDLETIKNEIERLVDGDVQLSVYVSVEDLSPIDAETRVEDTGDREAIAEIAYAHWKARGCPDGSSEEDWFRAELELRTRRQEMAQKE